MAFLVLLARCSLAAETRPNVVLVMSDDQGFGDLGVHGNPWVKTPELDRFAGQSVELTQFHVCPVCSPTRSSLLTGRYNYRTGIVDTALGRSLMFPDEVTLAEMLAAAGYRTGIFGKWHLGDNYPMRPGDQGFQESLVLKGGGLRQPSDLPGGGSYFNPQLLHNGRATPSQGYCSDVFTDAAIEFLERRDERPFLVYLAYNAVHAPLEVPEEDYLEYKGLDLAAGAVPEGGHPLDGPVNVDQTAHIYGMVTNLDRNFGRLLAALDRLELARDTIVVFLTDNGPDRPRYNAGLRSHKASVYEGGIRVPCFVRWPARLEAGKKVDRLAAHIDMLPTLLEACRVKPPDGVRLDGRSLLPLLTGESADWPQRTLYFQWHRGDRPEMYRACAARGGRWKLVQAQGIGEGQKVGEPRFELFDLAADPYEVHDVAAEHADIVERMRAGYEAWFREMEAERHFAMPRIDLGAPEENPVLFTRQDWRGPRAGWKPGDLGHWDIDVLRGGPYEVTLHFAEQGSGGTAHVAVGGAAAEQPVKAGAASATFSRLLPAKGPARLEAWIERDGKKSGVEYASVRWDE